MPFAKTAPQRLYFSHSCGIMSLRLYESDFCCESRKVTTLCNVSKCCLSSCCHTLQFRIATWTVLPFTICGQCRLLLPNAQHSESSVLRLHSRLNKKISTNSIGSFRSEHFQSRIYVTLKNKFSYSYCPPVCCAITYKLNPEVWTVLFSTNT